MTDDETARRQRQASLECRRHAAAAECLVVLAGEVAPAGGSAGGVLTVRYVPDRRVLTDAGWSAYRAACARTAWESLEDLASAVLTDLNNELVPRWLAVVAEAGEHRVLLQDRQPKWSNPELLALVGLLAPPQTR